MGVDRRLAERDAVLEIGRDDQNVRPGRGDAPDQRAHVVGEDVGEGRRRHPARLQLIDRAQPDRPAVRVVGVGDGPPQWSSGAEPRRQLVADEPHRVATEVGAHRRHAEEAGTALGQWRGLADGTGLPQHLPEPGRGRAGRRGDDAGVGPDHQRVVARRELLHRGRCHLRTLDVDEVERNATALHTPALIGQLDRELRPAGLLGAALPLRTGERIDRAEPERRARGGAATRAGAGAACRRPDGHCARDGDEQRPPHWTATVTTAITRCFHGRWLAAR